MTKKIYETLKLEKSYEKVIYKKYRKRQRIFQTTTIPIAAKKQRLNDTMVISQCRNSKCLHKSIKMYLGSDDYDCTIGMGSNAKSIPICYLSCTNEKDEMGNSPPWMVICLKDEQNKQSVLIDDHSQTMFIFAKNSPSDIKSLCFKKGPKKNRIFINNRDEDGSSSSDCVQNEKKFSHCLFAADNDCIIYIHNYLILEQNRKIKLKKNEIIIFDFVPGFNEYSMELIDCRQDVTFHLIKYVDKIINFSNVLNEKINNVKFPFMYDLLMPENGNVSKMVFFPFLYDNHVKIDSFARSIMYTAFVIHHSEHRRNMAKTLTLETFESSLLTKFFVNDEHLDPVEGVFVYFE